MLITHVIPAYNSSETIGRALDSVFSNSAPEGWAVESVVVDDGSEDGDELAKVVAKYPLARLLVHDTNRGSCAARNSGIADSRGDFVIMLDSDDELAEHWFSIFGKIIQEWPDNIKLCFAACQTLEGEITNSEPGHQGLLTLNELLNERYSGEYIPIFRGDYIRKNFYVDLGTRKNCGTISYIKFAHDGPFWISPQVLRVYHVGISGSVTSGWTTPEKAKETIDCYAALFERYGSLYRQNAPRVYHTKLLKLAVYQRLAGIPGAWQSWRMGISVSVLFESIAAAVVLIVGSSIGSKLLLLSKKFGLVRRYG